MPFNEAGEIPRQARNDVLTTLYIASLCSLLITSNVA